jgi:hypothetical protein
MPGSQGQEFRPAAAPRYPSDLSTAARVKSPLQTDRDYAPSRVLLLCEEASEDWGEMGTDLGNAPDWITAIVALIALAIATWAAKATVATNNAQQATLQLQTQQWISAQSERERRQASEVTFWFFYSRSADGSGDLQAIDFFVGNASRSPIYNLRLEIPTSVHDSTPTAIHCQLMLFPSEREGELVLSTSDPAILARFNFQAPGGEFGEEYSYLCMMSVVFIDTAGFTWRRWYTGVLDLLESPPAPPGQAGPGL